MPEQKEEDRDDFFPFRLRKEISHVGSQKFLDTDHALGMMVRTFKNINLAISKALRGSYPHFTHGESESERGDDLPEVTQLVRDTESRGPNPPGVGTKQESSPTYYKKIQLLLLPGWLCDLKAGSPSLGLTSFSKANVLGG